MRVRARRYGHLHPPFIPNQSPVFVGNPSINYIQLGINRGANGSIDNFAPDLADTFQLLDLTGGTASSWFSSVVAPEGWTLSSGVLLAIPEPSSALLLGIGILCVAGYRRDSLV